MVLFVDILCLFRTIEQDASFHKSTCICNKNKNHKLCILSINVIDKNFLRLQIRCIVSILQWGGGG